VRPVIRVAVAAALASCTLACVSVQDLGSDRPAPQPTAARPNELPRLSPIAPVPTANPASCPSLMPVENTACSNVAWCAYSLSSEPALSANCGCALGHWICLRVRNDHRANETPEASLPLTSAACTEGAMCDEGSSCKVGMERWCDCRSNGRLRCRRPTH